MMLATAIAGTDVVFPIYEHVARFDGEGEGEVAGDGDPSEGNPSEGDEGTALGGAGDDGDTGGEKTEGDEGKAAEGAGDEGKKTEGEGEGDASQVPEGDYDLTLPEGEEYEGKSIDKDALALATPIMKEAGVTQEQAQKLLPAMIGMRQHWVEQDQKATLDSAAQQRADWLKEAKADETVGGKNWNESMALSARALDALGHPKGSPFRELMDASGLGNHPSMIKVFRQVGELVGEDGVIRGGSISTKQLSDAEKMYGEGYGKKET